MFNVEEVEMEEVDPAMVNHLGVDQALESLLEVEVEVDLIEVDMCKEGDLLEEDLPEEDLPEELKEDLPEEDLTEEDLIDYMGMEDLLEEDMCKEAVVDITEMVKEAKTRPKSLKKQIANVASPATTLVHHADTLILTTS